MRIAEETADDLAEYGTVPIAFRVETQFRIEAVEGGLGGLSLVYEPVAVPYVKDYDSVASEGPTRWASQFDLTNWGILATFDKQEQRIGGAAVAWNTPGVDILEGRGDLAVLWDLRVRPDYRGRGVGRALFAAALAWAQERNCRALKIETQNINVSSCRFYARQGCVLQSIRMEAYPDCPGEAQLIWLRDLSK